MQNYTLYDMLGMVRLGCWDGGFVEKIGYVGGAVGDDDSHTICGVTGLYISPTVMIESIEPSDLGGHRLNVSYYDPYEGKFVTYGLPLAGINADLSLSTLMNILEGGEGAKRGLSSSNYPYRERRYKPEYSSLRGGSISTPRESKIFRRR